MSTSEIKPKKPIYKKWWLWVIIVLVIGGIVVGVSGGSKSNDGNSGNSSSSPTQTTYNVGDTISANGLSVTVKGVERNYSTGKEYITAPDGKEYVKVNISIENQSNDKASFNALDWSIEDSNGVIDNYMSAAMASADDNLGSGDLAKGGKKTGSIVFQVPSGDSGLKLHYKPSFWSGNEYTINL